MNKPALLGTTVSLVTPAKALAVAVVLGVWAASSDAAQTAAAFRVTVSQPGNPVPDESLCRFIGAFGASVTVSCPPGMGFITLPPAVDKLQDTVISDTDAGTVTTWRMIRLENGDYLEMTVQW